MTDRSDFPGAPPLSYVSEEGWLVIGDQAWTLEEWHSNLGQQYRRNLLSNRTRKRSHPRRYESEADRDEARRRSRREYLERQRAAS